MVIFISCIVYYIDGNGFKTSTMRLGADAIVFSRACRGRYDFCLKVGCSVYFMITNIAEAVA